MFISGGFTPSTTNGWRFTALSAIHVTGLRMMSYYNAQSQKLNLWDLTTSTLIGTVTVMGSMGVWVEGSIVPVTLIAGRDYIIATNAQAGGSVYYYRSNPPATEFNEDYIAFIGARLSGVIDTIPTNTAYKSTPAVDIIFDVGGEPPAEDVGIMFATFV